MLSQPATDRLASCRRVLLAGCGGGYDVLGAVPLVAALRDRGVDVHLASLSFCYLNALDGAERDVEVPSLYAVGAAAASERAYSPEAWLAGFLDQRLGAGHRIWCFDKTGVRPLLAAYRALVRRLQLDAIVLIDGGIDALLRGDETSLGTPAEDLTSLAAVAALEEVPTRMVAAVGLGAELRDGIQHAQVFERIAELTRAGGFLGTCSLLPGSAEGDLYLAAVDHVFAHQQEQKRSHVHKVISAACRGDFGSDAPHVWLSALLNMYWFFDLPLLARTHMFLDDLAATDSIWDVSARIEGIRKQLPIKPRTTIPL
jgi:hypothetical protein